MGLEISLDELTPASLWSALDKGTQELAARALYQSARVAPTTRQEADLAIAAALRFREVAVRRLSTDRRAGYLLRAVRPTDSLASGLLLALHLEHRQALLGRFLNDLEIPHEEGMISDDFDLQPPTAEALQQACEGLFADFAEDEASVYLATLLALDDEIWGGVRETLASHGS